MRSCSDMGDGLITVRSLPVFIRSGCPDGRLHWRRSDATHSTFSVPAVCKLFAGDGLFRRLGGRHAGDVI